MFRAEHYRLDWHAEFEKLSPYLRGRGGVVRLEYSSENAAPHKFNHLLKEGFGKPDNGIWRSLRIDHEWFTTRHVLGVIDEIDRLLTEAGFPAKNTEGEPANVNILTDVDVGGNMITNINELTINNGTGAGGRAVRARAKAVFSAMQRYVESGGRFMVIVNDMAIPDQTDFWQQIWHGGLSAAGGDHMLLVIHAGPKAAQLQHHDSPEADERIVLPDSVEEDSMRDCQIFDDLIDAFKAAGIEEAGGPAGVHLENNRTSILDINTKLSAAIMSAKRGQERSTQ